MTDPMNGQWHELDIGPAASAQMIQWYAPQTREAMRDAVTTEMAARGWGHTDRDSLALVLDKIREDAYANGMRDARDVDRVGYVVVRHSEPGTFPYPEYSLVDASLWWDHQLADVARSVAQTDADAVGDDRRYFIGAVHEVEEAAP